MAQGRTVPPVAPVVAQPKPAPDLTALLRIATLAHNIAERYVSGKHGLAIENASNEVLHLWDSLPDEIRRLL
jgi:hypothetical protein